MDSGNFYRVNKDNFYKYFYGSHQINMLSFKHILKIPLIFPKISEKESSILSSVKVDFHLTLQEEMIQWSGVSDVDGRKSDS